MFTGAHRRGHLSTKFLCSGVVTSGVILDKLSCENYAVSDVVTCAFNECETNILKRMYQWQLVKTTI